jgi:hypothetical protein
MPNQRDELRSYDRDRHNPRQWGRDDERERRMSGDRGEPGRFAEDDDRFRRMDHFEDDDRGMRRRDELRSVGSPGIGGGTGGQWDRGGWDHDRDDPRFGRGRGRDEQRFDRSGRPSGWTEDDRWRDQDRSRSWGRGRDEQSTYFGDEERRGPFGYGRDDYGRRYAEDRMSSRGMSTSAGWGDNPEGGGNEAGWSPGQASTERIGRGWGGDVGRTPMTGREPRRGDREGGFAGRGLPGAGLRGHAGKGPMNYTRPDQRIHEDVCDILTDDDEIDASSIDCKVDKGEVTLTGSVSSRDMKRRAEEIAERVPGVKDVHNQIKVKPERRDATGKDGREGKDGQDARDSGNGSKAGRS